MVDAVGDSVWISTSTQQLKKKLGCKKIITDTCVGSQGVRDFRTKKI